MTPNDRVLATYLIETPYPMEHALDVLVGEQTLGTFVSVPGEQALKELYRGSVEHIQYLNPAARPSLTGKYSAATGVYQRAIVQVAIPVAVTGVDLLNTMAAVLGNVFELKEISGLRLLDIDFPDSFASAYPGPQFGIEGTRALTGVSVGPMIGSIIKPSVGLTPEQTADLVHELAVAGIDFVKDDELMASPPYSPLEKRVDAVMGIINRIADRTGKKVMFAFNISADDTSAMLRNHDLVVEHGGTCVMVSINHIGFAAFLKLRRHAQVPIHGHRNGWGMFTRAELLGIDFQAYRKLWGLAGVDQLHVNGIQNKFWEPDESVARSIAACLTPLFGKRVMPVVSSGQWGGQAPETYRLTGTTDLLYLAGGGIQAHPLGPTAGVLAIRQAWDAAVEGIPLADYADDHPELQHAIEMFDKRTP